MSSPHESFMRRALLLAEKGKGCTGSNPMVGAILVHNDCIIGEGWHARYGGPHAEVACLDSVVENYRHLIPASTIYVTLEPCAHWGKTPPCADRIISEGLKKVVIALRDPFSEVDGKGIQKLRAAGVDVTVGLQEEEAQWQARRFLTAQTKKRPYIILKWAESRDGFMAPADRKRTQLSNGISQRLVHRWRTEESAVLVGYNTALHDNPQLTARLHAGPQPLRILLDRQLAIPQSHALYNKAAATWILNEIKGGEENGIRFIHSAGVDELQLLVETMMSEGAHSLIVEGGAAILYRFIGAGLWDEARIFKTPVLLCNGLPAPVLTRGVPALSTQFATDDLELWTRIDAVYPYVAGMPL